MKPNLLVTGATGRLGQLVAASLAQQGIAWTAFARNASAAEKLGATQVALGDFDAIHGLQEALQGIEKVILIAGDAPDQDAKEIRVVEAAKAAGVKRIVKLSAQSAGLTPPVSFGKKHIAVERAILSSGMDYTFIRPVFFQQSFLMFSDSIRKNNKVILPAGQGLAAFVDARDVADCLVTAAKSLTDAHTHKIYTLTGSRALSFANAANIIGLERGKPVGYISPPAWLARIVLPKAAGMPKWLATEVIDLLGAISKGAQAPVTPDVEKLLGRPPRSFEAFAKEHVAAFK